MTSKALFVLSLPNGRGCIALWSVIASNCWRYASVQSKTATNWFWLIAAVLWTVGTGRSTFLQLRPLRTLIKYIRPLEEILVYILLSLLLLLVWYFVFGGWQLLFVWLVGTCWFWQFQSYRLLLFDGLI